MCTCGFSIVVCVNVLLPRPEKYSQIGLLKPFLTRIEIELVELEALHEITHRLRLEAGHVGVTQFSASGFLLVLLSSKRPHE